MNLSFLQVVDLGFGVYDLWFGVGVRVRVRVRVRIRIRIRVWGLKKKI